MRIILRDGRVAEMRPPESTPEDRKRIEALFSRASHDSLYFRFFHVVSHVSDKELDRMMAISPRESYSLICDAGDEFLGIGNYVRSGADAAEVAFLVDDRIQGRGLGTLFLEHLADHAWHDGFRQFVAFVLSENQRMLGVFRSSGFSISQHWADGALELTLPLNRTERQRSLAALREKLATAASLRAFFAPKTVAVVGASRDEGRLGHSVLRNIIENNFQGTVYPVNREASSVLSIKSYDRIADIPEPVDLAVIVVPVKELLGVINDAIYAGVKGIIITTAVDPTDVLLRETLVTKLRRSGIRLIGPTSMGMLTTHPGVSFNGSLSDRFPHAGGLAVASHSGALGMAIMQYASAMGLGLSSFVSLGDKADVSGNDLLQYWEDDPETQAIMLYMESFGNPRKFSQITRRITRTKPILAVKSARVYRLGTDQTPNRFHWDLVDAPVDALFRQSGIIRADTLEELFDVAAIVTTQPLLRGSGLGLITNSTAGTRITEDTLHGLGLHLVHTVDVGFSHLAEGYSKAIESMMAYDDIDALLILYVPVAETEAQAVLQAISKALVAHDKDIPIIANVLFAEGGRNRFMDVGSRRMPIFRFPETALRALERAYEYGQFVQQPQGRVVDLPDIDVNRAREEIRRFLSETASATLSDDAVSRVCSAMGVSLHVRQTTGKPTHPAIGVLLDPLFGPLIGVQTEESRIRLLPLTDQDAIRLVPDSLPLESRDGWVQLLLRLARLVEECPEITGLELLDVEVGSDDLSVTTGLAAMRVSL